MAVIFLLKRTNCLKQIILSYFGSSIRDVSIPCALWPNLLLVMTGRLHIAKTQSSAQLRHAKRMIMQPLCVEEQWL